MRKIVISMLVFVLVFSELNVFVAETIVGDPTELEIECEKQLESDEENLATECKEPETENGENPTSEGEGQPETENGENLISEGEGQPETGNGENPTSEGEGQPGTENGENPTTEGEGQPGAENGEDPATEGEGQPEAENGEDPISEEEEQPESGNEEGLVPLCVEQSEFEIEENSTTEGEEQLESNSEEELTTEDEEQLGSNSEEVLVFEGEEQLGTNSEEELENNEEKPAPNCKRATRAARGPGIPISDVGKIGDIDFSALDDSEKDLKEKGYTLMERNRGLEIPQRKGEDGRTYYMYFGDLYNGRTSNTLDNMDSYKNITYNDDWGRPLPNMNQTLSEVINSKHIRAEIYQVALALDNSVITYFFSSGRPSRAPDGSGMMIAHGSEVDGEAQFQSTFGLPLLKLYKNETTHELIGYAAVINKVGRNDYLDGYVRIKMRPKDGNGRITVSMKYLKLSDKYKYTNFAYSTHVDIYGRHTSSKMYSLGDSKGFYFFEKITKTKDYYLFFFRDGYANHPTAFKANNDPIHHPFSNAFYPKLNAEGTVDPGKGLMKAFQTHPGFALRWDPQKLEPDTVREVNLEMAISDSLEEKLAINLENDSEYKDDGYHISGTWNGKNSERIRLYYTVDKSEPKLISENENLNVDTDVPWEYTIPNIVMEEGLDHEITVYIMDEYDQKSNIETIKVRPALDIKEQVFNQDGNEAEEVAPGDTLSYKILVDSGYNLKDPYLYGQFTITQKYDTHLEPPTDLKVVDDDGFIVGTATYNSSAIEVKLKPDLPRSTKVTITFNAKVKDDATEGEYVVGQGTATGKYSTGDAVNGTSNEVKVKITGVLTFVSAPQEIDFGKKLAISPKNKKYYPIQLDRPLAVQDNRSLSRKPSWMMTAKLEQPLTGEKTGATLDSLHYRYGEKVSILTEEASAEIYEKETKNREVVDISNTWNPDGDGLYLEVTAGTAKADAYKGTIRWVLQDVPLNE
ncbi:isopeptide-forming domain-containing fimbrial protein [Lysinibacillus xylanilyticus]|uniref:WxL domain-containing protein n=2 Tax=Lysinibacillus xylanilyticus TaxID=582475 RepID=A0A2M9PY80_9BACI|nr:isopeptide-forming domain-containing fimbrial protein [Lysinibacillus xylanilyticus]PJO40788.1 hypothetical protein CWD94_26275 [Lysinibacillus xylanilyticus]